MKRKYACELGVGEKIEIPPQMLISKAVIKSCTTVPCPKGDIVVFQIEANEGPVTLKGTVGFPADYNVPYFPPRKPFWSRLGLLLALPFTFWLS